jgi:hypothetical protein
MTSIVDPASGGLGSGLSSAIQTIFTEGTVIFCFICLFIAILAFIARIIGLLLELRRARIRVLARQRDEERMLAEAAKIREENKKKAATYKSPLEGRVFLPGQVTFEEVMRGTINGPAAGAGGATVAVGGEAGSAGVPGSSTGDGGIADGSIASNSLNHRQRGERKSYVAARVPQAGAGLLPRIDSLQYQANDPGTRISTASTATTLK